MIPNPSFKSTILDQNSQSKYSPSRIPHFFNPQSEIRN